MDQVWSRAIEFATSLAASGVNEFLFYVLQKRGIINDYTRRESRREYSWNAEIQEIRQRIEQEPLPPLPIAVQFEINRGEVLTLEPGFLAIPWIDPIQPIVTTRLPHHGEWPRAWRRHAKIKVYLIKKDLKQLKIQISFDDMPTTQDGYTICWSEINVSFKVTSPVHFVNEFLRGPKPIFEEKEFIDEYLKWAFAKALRRYVSNFRRSELEDQRISTRFEEHLETEIKGNENLERILRESGMKLVAINDVKIGWDENTEKERFEKSCAKLSIKFRPSLSKHLYGLVEDTNLGESGIMWRAKMEGKISGKLAIHKQAQCVAIATLRGHVYFLDYSGKVQKHYQAEGEEFEAGIVFWQGRAIVTSRSGKIWLIPITNTQQSRPEPEPLRDAFFHFSSVVQSPVIRTSPAIYRDSAFFSVFGPPDGIYRLDLNSTHPKASSIYRTTSSHIKASPIIIDDAFLLFAASKGWGRCDLNDLNRRAADYSPYSQSHSSVSNCTNPRVASRSIVFDASTRTLFVPHTTLGLLAIDIDSQEVKGRVDAGAPIWVAPTLYGHTAFVGNNRGEIIAIDADGRNPDPSIWPKKISEHAIKSQGAVWRDLLFVADTRGTIYAIKIKEGMIWWTYSMGGVVTAPLWVNEEKGTLLVANKQGRIIALKWHLDEINDGINMLEAWGNIEEAGHLAFLNGEYQRAEELWRRAKSDIGRKIIHQCRNRTAEETSVRKDAILEIEPLHSPSCKWESSITFQFRIQLHTENPEPDKLFISITGDLQEPIIDEKLSEEEVHALLEDKNLVIKRTITPSQLGTSKISIRVVYEALFTSLEARMDNISITVKDEVRLSDVQTVNIFTGGDTDINTGDVALLKSQGDIRDIHVEGDAGAIINRGGDMVDVSVEGNAGFIRNHPGDEK